MKKFNSFMILIFVVALLSACTTAAPEAAEELLEDETVLKVGEKTYTKKQLEALGTMESDYTGKDGETTTYTGVLLSNLLADADMINGENITFVAADGFEGVVSLADALACDNCIIGFYGESSLRTVMPDFGGKANVKDLVEISVE